MNILLKPSPETPPKIRTRKKETQILKTKDPAHSFPGEHTHIFPPIFLPPQALIS